MRSSYSTQKVNKGLYWLKAFFQELLGWIYVIEFENVNFKKKGRSKAEHQSSRCFTAFATFCQSEIVIKDKRSFLLISLKCLNFPQALSGRLIEIFAMQVPVLHCSCLFLKCVKNFLLQ